MKITLLAEPEPVEIDSKRTAVIVVDMQNGFCSKGGLLDVFGRLNEAKTKTVIHATGKAIEAARKSGIPVVYLKHTYRPDLSDAGGPESPNYWKELGAVVMREHPEHKGKFLTRGTWDWEVVDELKPQAGDLTVEKNRFSGFTNPELNEVLRKRNIKYLIFTGIATNVCVESTLRDAFFNEYFPIMLKDSCGNVGPDYLQDATVWNVTNIFGWVATTEEFEKALKG
jgi:ureidoacrylate peracid hydrolase